MKLKTQLREAGLERLLEIASFWDLTPGENITGGASEATEGDTESESLEDSESLADYLYPRMQTPANFKAAFDKLDTSHREWVYFLALHGGELPLEEMRRRCGFASNEELLAATAPLSAHGFIWRERLRDELITLDLIGIPEPFVRLVELPPYWQGFLGFYLQELGIDELRAIAKATLDERPASRKKQALVHYIRKKMLDPKLLQETLNQRDPLQLDMFQQILNKNGVCAWKDLLDTGVHKKFDHVRAEKLRDLVENSGLVFVLRAAANKYNNLLMVPRDLATIIQTGYKRDERSLEEISRAGSESQPKVAGESSMRPGVILDNSNYVLRDLAIICAFIQRYGVKMLNNGGLGRNDLKKIVPLLSYNKTIKYVQFLALFAIVKKLIIPVGEQWRVSGTLPMWLARGQICFREIYEFWLNTNEWNEEYIDGDVVHADNYPQNLISITELRKLILRMLEKIPYDSWIDFETFAESLLPQFAIEIPGRFDLTPSDKFNRHPLLIMESVVAETLYWLGIVMLGVSDLEVARRLGSRPNEAIAPYDPSRPLSARLIGEENLIFCFRLTDFGRTLLSRNFLDPAKVFSRLPDAELPYAEFNDTITVQPNLEVVAPPDMGLESFFRLLQFTDIKKVDVMTTLSIAHESVRAGLDHGLSSDAMLELLARSSRKELPETVRQLISECQARHGEIDMGLCGGYLKVSDRMRLEELKANNKIAPAIKDIFDDHLILLSRTADFKKIGRELQRMGYLPHIDSDSLYATGEGLFQVTLRPEELYDLLALIRFAIMLEEDGAGDVFEDRVRPLFERLSVSAQEKFNPNFYAESIARNFFTNFEKYKRHLSDEESKKYRKQIQRLMAQMPRNKPATPKGPQATSEPGEIQKLIRHAIEHETPLKIKYERSNGEVSDLVVEPEALQGKKLYAFCPDRDEHHIYALERIQHAAM
jgi:hypothetical protein